MPTHHVRPDNGSSSWLVAVSFLKTTIAVRVRLQVKDTVAAALTVHFAIACRALKTAVPETRGLAAVQARFHGFYVQVTFRQLFPFPTAFASLVIVFGVVNFVDRSTAPTAHLVRPDNGSRSWLVAVSFLKTAIAVRVRLQVKDAVAAALTVHFTIAFRALKTAVPETRGLTAVQARFYGFHVQVLVPERSSPFSAMFAPLVLVFGFW